MRLLITTTALSLCLVSAASAQEFSLGAGASSLGPMVEGTVGINDNFAFRGIGYIPFGVDINNIDVGNNYTLDGTVNIGAGALLADWYPWGGGVRVSGGVFIGQEELATGRFTSSIAGAPAFDGALTLDNPIAPMLSAGYQYDFNSGWYIAGDIGAVITGFTVTSTTAPAAVRPDIDAINRSLDDIPAYPYVAISFGFTF